MSTMKENAEASSSKMNASKAEFILAESFESSWIPDKAEILRLQDQIQWHERVIRDWFTKRRLSILEEHGGKLPATFRPPKEIVTIAEDFYVRMTMSPTDQQLDALAQLLSKAPSLQSAYTTLQLKSWLQSFFEERDVLASLTPTEVVVPAGVNNLGSNRALRVRMSNDTRFILITFYENRSTNPSGQQMEDLLQIINTIEPSYTIKKMKVWFSKRRAAEKKKELEAIAAEYADFKEKDNRAMWQQTISSGSADSATVMPTAAIESLKTLLREDKDPSPTFASLTKWASELGVNVVAIVLWLNNNPPPYGAIEPEASIQADASSQSIHLPTPEGTTSPELEERQSLPPLSPLENPIISSIPRHNGDDESKYFQGNSRQEKTMRPPRVKGLRFAPTSEPPTIPPIFDQTAKARIQEAFQAGVTDYPEPPRSLQEFEARFEELDVLMEEILGSD